MSRITPFTLFAEDFRKQREQRAAERETHRKLTDDDFELV